MANYSRTKLETISLTALAPQDLIARNFRVCELTRSELANRQGVGNSLPGDRELHAAVHLASKILQPVRNAFGAFTPNSVFRVFALLGVEQRRLWIPWLTKTYPAGGYRHCPNASTCWSLAAASTAAASPATRPEEG